MRRADGPYSANAAAQFPLCPAPLPIPILVRVPAKSESRCHPSYSNADDKRCQVAARSGAALVGEYSSGVEDLRGKTVLLTGASTGLGPHIARRLHQAGAKFVLSARNEEALQRLAKEIGESRVVVADLSKAGEPERLAKEAGEIDVLVSNAGVPISGRLAELKVEEIDRAIAVNLQAGIILAHALAPSMVRRKQGHIVFMSSVAGKVPAAGASIYNATKFGIRGFGL